MKRSIDNTISVIELWFEFQLQYKLRSLNFEFESWKLKDSILKTRNLVSKESQEKGIFLCTASNLGSFMVIFMSKFGMFVNLKQV